MRRFVRRQASKYPNQGIYANRGLKCEWPTLESSDVLVLDPYTRSWASFRAITDAKKVRVDTLIRFSYTRGIYMLKLESKAEKEHFGAGVGVLGRYSDAPKVRAIY
jgi:hypothetical protein